MVTAGKERVRYEITDLILLLTFLRPKRPKLALYTVAQHPLSRIMYMLLCGVEPFSECNRFTLIYIL